MFCTGKFYSAVDIDPNAAVFTISGAGYVHAKFVDPTVTGISESFGSSSSSSIFPNPAQTHLNILSEKRNTSFAIYNSEGKMALEGNPQNSIFIETLPCGIYFVMLYAEDGTNEVLRFVKQ
jgi:hypothetical protein